MSALFVVGVALGLVLGFYLGRWRAEFGRGRADASRAWQGRRSYRKGG